MQGFLPPSLVINATPLPQAAPPVPSARATVPNDEASFSRQLEQSRQRAQDNARPAPQAAAPKPAAAPPPPPAAPAPPQNKPPETARGDARTDARTDAQRAASRGPRKSDAPAKPESTAAEAEGESKPARRADGTEPITASELPGLPTPPVDPATLPAEGTAAQASTAGASLPDALAAGLPQAAALPGALRGAATGAVTKDIRVAGATLAAAGSSAPPTTALPQPTQATGRDPREAAGTVGTEPGTWQQAQAAAALAEGLAGAHDGAPRNTEAHAGSDSDRSLAPAGLAGPGSSPAVLTAKAGEVAQANLATPATSAEFRAALGAQVSIFARAGVQQAELHLNPAEMGPVSIQIVLDGQQAQVNFGADSPLTRHIIESGMPELAGALRDAGLTLTGGGVSQHAGGQRQDGNPEGSAGGNGSDVQSSGTVADGTTDAQVAQVRRSAIRVAQGGVDLFA